MSKPTLKEIFDKYAGTELRLDPNRMTRDMDPVIHQLATEVKAAGFSFGSEYEKGVPAAGCMGYPGNVDAEYERAANGKYRLTGNFKLW